jgi:hypothetical protein
MHCERLYLRIDRASRAFRDYGIGQVTQYVGAVTSFSGSLTGLISTLAMLWENAVYMPMLYEFLDLPDLKYQAA